MTALLKDTITMAYQSVNPNTGQLLKSFEHPSNAQLEHALANDSDFGLGGSVWMQDEARGRLGRC
jgi:hypothetical protein